MITGMLISGGGGNNISSPANMRCWPNVGLPLGQRRRRWANSKPALDQRLMFAGLASVHKVTLGVR